MKLVIESFEFQGKNKVVVSAVDEQGTIYHGILNACGDCCSIQEEKKIIRCNNCYKLFEDEEDLKVLTDLSNREVGYYKGCPDCKSDKYLMDIAIDIRKHYNEYVENCNINQDSILHFNEWKERIFPTILESIMETKNG